MPVEITIPSPGESVTEVTLGPWAKSDGAWVEKDELLVEIESDKVTLEVPAPESGLLSIAAKEGDEKSVGDVIGSIDPSAKKPEGDDRGDAHEDAKPEKEESDEQKATSDREAKPARAEQESEPAARNEVATATSAAADSGAAGVRATSLAKKVAADKGVDLARVEGSGPSGRIRRSDVLAAGTAPASSESGGGHITVAGERGIRREKMSRLRQRIAQRLVEAQHNAAMLTTFNEVDMTEVMRVRKQHKENFSERFGVNLGFMSFFVKASTSALMEYPRVNAYISGEEIEYHDYCDVSIAVGTDKGLVVPVLRSAEQMTFADVEATIKDFAVRARDGKLSIDEMTGGTFTISNGGVYGSLNSTPILNPPQSGILGMHRIQNRPIEDPNNPGSIVLRPMMYLAMSYDHRIVDGAEAVSFLVHVKNALEQPERMLLGM